MSDKLGRARREKLLEAYNMARQQLDSDSFTNDQVLMIANAIVAAISVYTMGENKND